MIAICALLQSVSMEPTVTTVCTTVVVTVWMNLPVTNKLDSVKEGVNRDLLTHCVINVCKCSLQGAQGDSEILNM